MKKPGGVADLPKDMIHSHWPMLASWNKIYQEACSMQDHDCCVVVLVEKAVCQSTGPA